MCTVIFSNAMLESLYRRFSDEKRGNSRGGSEGGGIVGNSRGLVENKKAHFHRFLASNRAETD